MRTLLLLVSCGIAATQPADPANEAYRGKNRGRAKQLYADLAKDNLYPAMIALEKPSGDEVPKDLARYFVVILKAGPKRDQPQEVAEKIQIAHQNYIQEQRNKGIYVVAGPFENMAEWRGMIIVDASSESDARTVIAEDPAVRAGRLTFELHGAWFPRSAFSCSPTRRTAVREASMQANNPTRRVPRSPRTLRTAGSSARPLDLPTTSY